MGKWKSCVSLVLLIVLIFGRFITIDGQTFHKRRTVNGNGDLEKIVKFHQNTSLSISPQHHNSDQTITKWTTWSKCEACSQQRVKITFSPISNMEIEEFQEKPCKQTYCLRQWHKKSNKRMSIFKIHKKDFSRIYSWEKPNENFKHIFQNSNNNQIGNNRKTRIWSKWSAWSKCNSSCQTQRYKVCKKPGRCLKSKKYEWAHCFLSHSYCETYVKHMLNLEFDKQIDLHKNVITTTTPAPTAKRKPKKKQFCGRPLRKHSMMKIKGGRNANRSMWPWHIAIVNERNEVFCSGTLIAPRWVLTAGHCVKSQLKVHVNEYDLTASDGEIEIPIVWAKRHQKFNMQNTDNDIGLLYMQRGVKTPVACLPTSQPVVNHVCTILGWGALNSYSEIGYPILQEAKIPIVNNTTCKSAYSQYYISYNMFCAGLTSGEIDTCAGDSGGGLMCTTRMQSKNRTYKGYTVQGITSFGEGCGKRHRYGIYTNVANYIDWIHRTMSNPPKHDLMWAQFSRSRHRYYWDDWNGEFFSYD